MTTFNIAVAEMENAHNFNCVLQGTNSGALCGEMINDAKQWSKALEAFRMWWVSGVEPTRVLAAHVWHSPFCKQMKQNSVRQKQKNTMPS